MTDNMQIQRILAVDDEPAILYMVKERLTIAGFKVQTAESGEEAMEVIKRYGLPHLAIVDLNMPRMSGFELCEKIQSFADLPIIILSAVDEEDTVIQGIERFAEDYVTKPFSPRELVARVQRVLRRIGDFEYVLESLTKVDDNLTISFAQQQALVGEQPISLTPTETKLLYILIRNAGQAVTTDFLLRRLWPMEDVFEDTLRVHVYRLRHKIEKTPSKPHYIITKRGIGYTFPKKK